MSSSKIDIKVAHGIRLTWLIRELGFASVEDFSKAANNGKHNTKTSTHKTGGTSPHFGSLVNHGIGFKIPLFYLFDYDQELILKRIDGKIRIEDGGGNIIIEDYSFDLNMSNEDHYLNALELFSDNILLIRTLSKMRLLDAEFETKIAMGNLSKYENAKHPPSLKQIGKIAYGNNKKTYSLFIPLSFNERELIKRKEGWLKKRIAAERGALEKLARETPKELQRLLLSLKPEGSTLEDLMIVMKLKAAKRFTKKYIDPALGLKLIKLEQPKKKSANSPGSYKITTKGKDLIDYYEEIG